VDTDVVDADGDGRHGRHPGIPTTATTPYRWVPSGSSAGQTPPGRSATGTAQ
jgi:hypothetical protein